MLLFALFLLFAQALSAQTWTGNTNTDWHIAANWNPAAVPTAADDVIIPNTANHPIISAAAAAKSVWIKAGGELSIQANMPLTIQGSGLFNEGSMTNNGILTVGATLSPGPYGVRNDGIFSNGASGVINIDRSTSFGLACTSGTFTNTGKITIGAVANVGSYGLISEGLFNNNQGGLITIDRSTLIGLFIPFGTFTNAAKITIGAVASVGQTGLQDESTFDNLAGGEISIDRSTDTGLFNFLGTFNNAGQLTLGAGIGTGLWGLKNTGTFGNQPGGQITIDRSTSEAMANYGGSFTNAAEIIIGATATAGQYGIVNHVLFSNLAGGEISIDQTLFKALLNFAGTFKNAGLLKIGSTASAGPTGIFNQATFNNMTGGDIRIDRCTDTGLYNFSGAFTNAAQITIGNTVTVGPYGLQNNATFNNNTGGEITINRSFYNLLNASVFLNAANITLGSLAFTQYGLTNEGTFKNNAGGGINIDRTSFTALLNTSGAFTNSARISIGANAAAGQYGLRNQDSFYNDPSGEISIDQTTGIALLNTSGNLTNNGSLTIGTGAGVTGNGLTNLATFLSTACSRLILFAPLSNNNSFGNTGFMTVNTLGAHTNSALTNHGIIEYPQGNPIPNVTNNDLIVSPQSISCGPLMPALQIGGANSFTVDNQWFSDESLSAKAGDYNQGSNTFTPTNLPGGTHPVYFNVHNNNLSCDQVVSMQISYQALSNPVITATPTPLCKGSTLNLSVANAGAGVSYNWSGNGIVNISTNATTAVPTLAGLQTYQVTVSYPNACKTTGTVLVMVKALAAGTLSGPADYCGAATTELTFHATAGTGPFTLIINGLTYNNIADGAAFNVPIAAPGGTFNLSSVATATDCTNTGSPLSSVSVNCGNIPPTVNPPADVTVQCGSIPAPGIVLINSFCPTQVFYLGDTQQPGSCNNNYTIQRKWEAKDNCGHVVPCTQLITVVDNTAPMIACPLAKIIPAGPNCGGVIGAYSPVSVSDNCTPTNAITVTQSPAAATPLSGNNDSKTVMLTANDGCGNIGTCTFVVTLKDQTGPVLVCKNYTAQLSAAGTVSIVPADVYQSGTDNCGSVNIQSVVPSSFNCGNTGPNIVTLTASDGNGNTATCSATVTVKDLNPPTAKCQDATTTLDAGGTAWVKASSINNGSADNCSFTLLLSPNNFGCGQVGVNVVTLTVTDAGGNTATCTAKVTVKDLSAPTALCKNPTIYLDDNGQATLSAAQADNGSSDACGIATMSISKTQFNCSELQGSPWNTTLQVTDVHGLTASCLFQVTVKDKILPTAICKDATVHLGANGKVIVYPAELAADSYDNCSVWSYSPTAKTYTGANLGPNNLTITVKDWSGNPASCVSVVTVLPYTSLKSGDPDRSEAPGTAPADLAFNVFPNPASGNCTVTFQLPSDQSFVLRLFDLSGRLLRSQAALGVAGENSLAVPLTDLPSGLYLIDFQAEGLKKQSRLSVQEK